MNFDSINNRLMNLNIGSSSSSSPSSPSSQSVLKYDEDQLKQINEGVTISLPTASSGPQ